jgi:hypothetical protein
MPDAVYADPSERLPWLPNAAPPPERPRRRPRAPLIVSAGVAVALAAGSWALMQQGPAPRPVAVEPVETVALPPPTVAPEAAAEPQAPLAAEREALRPAPAESAATARPKRRVAKAVPQSKAAKRIRAAPSINAPPYNSRAWQSGVRGRIIQLGAFRTSAQAHGEWKRVYYRHPLLRPLPPRVVKSKIRGRIYYRLQLGTFSQAHSELLCQRLRAIGEGCIVLGLRGRR